MSKKKLIAITAAAATAMFASASGVHADEVTNDQLTTETGIVAEQVTNTESVVDTPVEETATVEVVEPSLEEQIAEQQVVTDDAQAAYEEAQADVDAKQAVVDEIEEKLKNLDGGIIASQIADEEAKVEAAEKATEEKGKALPETGDGPSTIAMTSLGLLLATGGLIGRRHKAED